MFHNNNGGLFDWIIELTALIRQQRQRKRAKNATENLQKSQHFRSSEQLDNPLFTSIADQVQAIHSDETLIATMEKDHTSHFKALIGANQTNKNLLSEMAASVMNTRPIKEHENVAIKQLSFQQPDSHTEMSFLRVVIINDGQKAIFPYLQTELKVPFHIDKIIEWDIDEPVKAEIEGTWNDVFTLSFFASDYAVNKHDYKLNRDINLRLSAFILDINETGVGADDVDHMESTYGFWPEERYGKFSHFEFEAFVLNVTEASISTSCSGCVLRLKILANKQGNDLIIDAFANYDNISAQTIDKGMRITGTLWFQGELAE